jgi:DNA-directed RNA polymerase specialized sigma24 family protein
MEWFHSTEREQERPNGGLASSHEIQSAFDEQREYLYWIALLITADDALANLAVVNASALSSNYSGVFRDWLNGWAKHATVRAAVREVRNLISASASRYVASSSEHFDDDVLSGDQIMSLRHVDPREITAALDPLARCALVLRGVEHASLADCALLLDVSRGIVARAYSQALRWNGEHIGAHAARNEDQTDSRV